MPAGRLATLAFSLVHAARARNPQPWIWDSFQIGMRRQQASPLCGHAVCLAFRGMKSDVKKLIDCIASASLDPKKAPPRRGKFDDNTDRTGRNKTPVRPCRYNDDGIGKFRVRSCTDDLPRLAPGGPVAALRHWPSIQLRGRARIVQGGWGVDQKRCLCAARHDRDVSSQDVGRACERLAAREPSVPRVNGGLRKASLKRVLRIRGRHPFRAEFCSLSGTEISREIAVYHRTEVRLTRDNSSMSAPR